MRIISTERVKKLAISKASVTATIEANTLAAVLPIRIVVKSLRGNFSNSLMYFPVTVFSFSKFFNFFSQVKKELLQNLRKKQK